ncbi:MAG: hypothetical protein ACK44F_01460 [Roseococcus sp.]
MPRLATLALLGATLALPAAGQGVWDRPDPACDFPPPAASAWAPSPWGAPSWGGPSWGWHGVHPAPSAVVTRRERLSEQDARAWYGEPRQAWHAEDDRRHGRWRGTGLFD